MSPAPPHPGGRPLEPERAAIDAPSPAPAPEAAPPGAAGPARRRIPHWLPPVLWIGVVLGASSIPDLQTTAEGIQVRDKLAHFGEYFVFGWLVSRALDTMGWSTRKHVLWTALIGLALGITDEFYQGFVPGREQDPLDLLADVTGVVAGWYFSREDETLGEARRTARNA